MRKHRKSLVIFDEKYSVRVVRQKNTLEIRTDSNKPPSNSTSNNVKIEVDVLDDILDEYKRLKKINRN